jgi:hypothetical protein
MSLFIEEMLLNSVKTLLVRRVNMFLEGLEGYIPPFHECIEGELDSAGWWGAFITFADGRTAAGEAAKVFVWDEGGG